MSNQEIIRRKHFCQIVGEIRCILKQQVITPQKIKGVKIKGVKSAFDPY